MNITARINEGRARAAQIQQDLKLARITAKQKYQERLGVRFSEPIQVEEPDEQQLQTRMQFFRDKRVEEHGTLQNDDNECAARHPKSRSKGR